MDITAIVLTYNEELHIERCIQNLRNIARRIIIIDSYSTDNTTSVANKNGAEVILHKWPGNQAEQFNWALDNVPINSNWIIRLDADEYLTKELTEEIKHKLPKLDANIAGISLSRTTLFMGRIKKHGVGSNVQIVRLFRTGRARYEQRIMDEHLIIDGSIIKFNNKFVDDNLNGIDFFIIKHLNYASREAAMQLSTKYNLTGNKISNASDRQGTSVRQIRHQKTLYNHIPLFLRAVLYFIYRYVVRMGFLDGLSGFLFDFFQGWWYRNLVDAKIWKAERACGNNKGKMLNYIKEVLHVEP